MKVLSTEFFVACAVEMEAIFPCFDLKPDDCNLATMILVHKLSVFGWYFYDWNGVNVQ